MKKFLTVALFLALALGLAAGVRATEPGKAEECGDRFYVPPGSKVIESGDSIIVEEPGRDGRPGLRTAVECVCAVGGGECSERLDLEGGSISCIASGCFNCILQSAP